MSQEQTLLTFLNNEMAINMNDFKYYKCLEITFEHMIPGFLRVCAVLLFKDAQRVRNAPKAQQRFRTQKP